MIQLQYEIDDSPLSVVAIDDISLSEGCRTGATDSRQNATACRDDQIFCEYEETCISKQWLCDGWCDCPAMIEGDQCPDESDEQCIVKPETTTPESATTLAPDTEEPPSVETTPHTNGPSDQTTGSTSKATTTKHDPGQNDDNNGDSTTVIIAATLGGAVAVIAVGVGVYMFYRFR